MFAIGAKLKQNPSMPKLNSQGISKSTIKMIFIGFSCPYGNPCVTLPYAVEHPQIGAKDRLIASIVGVILPQQCFKPTIE